MDSSIFGDKMKIGSLLLSNGYLGVVLRQGNGIDEEGMTWVVYWFDDCYSLVTGTPIDTEIIG